MQRKDACRRGRWLGWSLSGFLLIAGCQTVQPFDPLPAQSPAQDSFLGRVQNLRKKDFPAEIEPGPVLAPGKPIPITLDSVLRLAEDKNGQVRLARMKVEEAFNDQEMARKHWLPDISFGMGTWRHEGGIQDFQGNLVKSSYGSALAGLDMRGKYDWKENLFRRVEAERRFWQQKGELSKLTNENLLEASTTYIDLLAVRTGMAISQETEGRLNELLKQSVALAKVDPGLNVEVSRVHTELTAQSVLTTKLRQASTASSAKLAYLLGLDPCCELITMDRQLAPIKLIDASQPVQTIVQQVLDHGPGMHELEGLLRTVETARNSNYGWQHWIPSIELQLTEGAFAAGPGSQLDWANQMNLGVNLKWSLNEFVYAQQKRQQADLHIQQVQMSFQDLKLKLTLGVQEAREAILGGTDQMRLAASHIDHSENSYKLSDQRLKQNIKGRSTSEVLLAMRGLGGARLEYLQAVRDYNKAQLRLYSLAGTTEPTKKDHPEIQK